LSITENLTQLSALLAIPLILVILFYFAGRAIRLFSHQSSKSRHDQDGTEELLQLLVLSELLSARSLESADMKASTSNDEKED